MARKTVDLKKLVERGNEMLCQSSCSQEQREGMIQVIETALHAADNYGGFRFLSKFDEIPTGHKVGIHVRDDHTTHDLTFIEKFTDTDDTRRKYFTTHI